MVAEYSAQQSSTPTISYTATDMLGSPRVITDANRQVVSRRNFMAFSEEIAVGVGERGKQRVSVNTRKKQSQNISSLPRIV